MKVAIGSDHGGFALKQDIITYLIDNGYEVTDLGCHSEESVDYPDFAKAVSQHILDGKVERGILVCGTGIGISIAANRHSGIRAALCNEPFSAKMSREHNDANVLCLGGRIIGVALALEIVHTWLNTEFEGERHLRRIKMFD